MSYKRGIRRLLFPFWVVYGIAVLTYPLFEAKHERDQALRFDDAMYSVRDDAARQGMGEQSKCFADLSAQTHHDYEIHSPLSIYRSVGWSLLWVFPVALTVPPLLLYGFARAIWTFVAWVAAGFVADTSPK